MAWEDGKKVLAHLDTNSKSPIAHRKLFHAPHFSTLLRLPSSGENSSGFFFFPFLFHVERDAAGCVVVMTSRWKKNYILNDLER